MFSANLLGRSENTGFYSQQYIGSEGGFKSKINTPYADDYIVALNGVLQFGNGLRHMEE